MMRLDGSQEDINVRKKEAQRDRWLIDLLLLIILLQQMSYRTRGEGLVSKFIRAFLCGVTPREMFWQITRWAATYSMMANLK